jgi:hypothetical protein
MVSDLQGSVRFGFGAFTGEQTGACPVFDSVAPKLNNAGAIRTLYDAFAPPIKGETPTSQVLTTVGTLLANDTSPGKKYILFVTDGEPDFCDDGNPTCPVDAATWTIQSLAAQGIGTFVFGVDSKLSTVSGATLQAFANAGAGQPVASANESTIYPACHSNSLAWTQIFDALQRTSGPLATYSASSGTAPVYRPNPTDQQALKDLFARPVAGVKSCRFALASGYHVALDQLANAHVRIDGVDLPRGGDNGWNMTSTTVLELSGNSCVLWHDVKSRNISFDFPCGVVVAD